MTLRVHEVGSTDWPSAVTDGLTLACQICGWIPKVDYRVTDDEWDRVIADKWRQGVVCLECFIVNGGDPLTLQEIQVTGDGVTVVAAPVVAYRWGGS